MSELTNVFARNMRDLTTPNSVGVNPNTFDNAKVPIGNAPQGHEGVEALTIGQIKQIASTGSGEQVTAVKEEVKIQLDTTTTNLNTRMNNLDSSVTAGLTTVKTESTALANQLATERARAISEESLLHGKIDAKQSGYFGGYETKALLDAVTTPVPQVGSVAKVLNDPDPTLNGDYSYVNSTVKWKIGYNPEQTVKTWANSNALFKPVSVAANTNLNTLTTGYYVISSDSVAATLIGLPPQLPQPRRGFLFVMGQGTTAYQKFVRDFSSRSEAYERSGNGQTFLSTNFAYNNWTVADVTMAIDLFRVGNDLLTPKALTLGQDINTLETGTYFTPSVTIANSVLNGPVDLSAQKLFLLFSYSLVVGIRYQKLVRYTENSLNEMEVFERVSNGGGASTNQWLPWHRQVTESLIKANTSLNLFPNKKLTAEKATYYQATPSLENGFNVMTLNAAPSITYSYYDVNLSDSKYFNFGDTVTLYADISSDGIGLTAGGDISIQFLKGTTQIGSTFTAINSVANQWQSLTVSAVIPEETTIIRFRFIRRGGTGTYVKFRKPRLITSSWCAETANMELNTPTTTGGSKVVFVSKQGLDSADGSVLNPYLTLTKAVSAVTSTGGTIIVLDSEWYRESLNIINHHKIVIKSARNNRFKLVGSNKLVCTKTNGWTKVYQAPLAAKPTGMGGARGKPMIAEWGTPSSPIAARDIHSLQRGEVYRLPYTPLYEVASIALVETTLGSWYWENGIIYISATDGGDVTTKQMEARARTTFTHSTGDLELHRADIMFSSSLGFVSYGTSVVRKDCRAYGNYHNGWGDYANSTESYRDIGLDNGNDGFNGTQTVYEGVENLQTAVQANYYDPYGALNGDDGISFHIKGMCNIHGGLFEYNTKAGVVHVTGGGGNCYQTICREQDFGFYTATAAPDGRNKSTLQCHSTIAERNDINYCGGSNGSEVHCYDTTSVDPKSWHYASVGGKVIGRNARYSGSPEKLKSGDVTFIRDEYAA